MSAPDPAVPGEHRRLEPDEAREIAVAFLRKPMTERLHIAALLNVGDDLPERNDIASQRILVRVRETGQIDALRAELFGRDGQPT